MKDKETERHCPWLKKCGGCISVGKEYAATLREKEAAVRKLLKPYVSLSGIVGMDDPWYYRNKVHRVCSFVRNGRREMRVSGIYAEGTHRIVPVRRCLIENEEAQDILDTITDLAGAFRIRNYDEDTRQGLLRHILIRTAHATGQIMVVLVLSEPVLPGKNHFIKALIAKHPEITTIVLNVNSRITSFILGERETVVYGKGYIEDELCGKRFRISSKSFYQVNSVQTERLYRKAVSLANPGKNSRILDAYCGIGTIGIIAAEQAGEVIGVESNRSAVKDAIRNAKENRVDNIRFISEDAADFLAGIPASDRFTAMFMDPPREGASELFLRAAAKAAPSRIVYISCNPVTLASNLKYMISHGYQAAEAEAYDMFPWTNHVETVVLLTRKS